MPLLTNLFSSSTMSKPDQNPNPLQEHVSNKNGLSFFAFLISISFYISIFFFFNLSPSSLLHSTEFWFAISNNLVLIIAADYGSFSSSPRNTLDLYDSYTARTRASSIKKPVLDRSFQENLGDERAISFSQENESPGREIVVRGDPIEGVECFHEAREIFEAPRKGKSRACRRRSSGKARRMPENERMVLRRSKSERREEEEDDEFSRMSNEEVNKRVEEFIQRFNRQMRLQRLANF